MRSIKRLKQKLRLLKRLYNLKHKDGSLEIVDCIIYKQKLPYSKNDVYFFKYPYVKGDIGNEALSIYLQEVSLYEKINMFLRK